jgi:hypothetical protein
MALITTVRQYTSFSLLNEYTNGRKLARASDGRLWTVYMCMNGDYSICASYSDDGGLTWAHEVVYAPGYDVYNPSIAIDSNNNVHVVWQSDKVYYRKWESGTWLPVEQASDNDAFMVWEPAIAIDGDDNIHVTYGARTLSPPYYSRIFHVVNSGAGWSSHEAVSTGESYYTQGPSMAFDSDNSMHVVWVNASNNVLYRKKALGGWQGEENVSGLGSSYRQYYPVIAIDSNGYVHVVWYGTGWGSYPSKTHIQYRKRTTGWLSQVALTDTDSYNDDCTIALEVDDTVHVVWRREGTVRPLYHRKYTGSWAPEEEISPGFEYQEYPNLLWAYYPIVGGVKTNVLPVGYYLVFGWQESSVSDSFIKFFNSSGVESIHIPIGALASKLVAGGYI